MVILGRNIGFRPVLGQSCYKSHLDLVSRSSSLCFALQSFSAHESMIIEVVCMGLSNLAQLTKLDDQIQFFLLKPLDQKNLQKHMK